MLIGSADLGELSARAPTLTDFASEPVLLEQADVLQIVYEIGAAHREALLPPALHPTNPPLLTWLFYRCPSSPWGAFAMAQARIESRSGVRARGYLVSAVVNNAEAARALSESWGYATRTGAVTLRRQGDGVRGVVACGGKELLNVTVTSLMELGNDDIQYIANMNLAHTSAGLRLIQVEPTYRVHRAERGRPRVEEFNAAAWGDDRIVPVYAVSASLATADVTVPPVRFVCRPDVLAFEGTEKVSRVQPQ